MTYSRIQIARGTVELGELSAKEAIELLQAGFLREGDIYRASAQEEWRPLTELQAETEPVAPTAMTKVRDTASRIGTSALTTATRMVSRTGRGGITLGAGAIRLLEDFLPWIQQAASTALSKTTRSMEEVARDENFLRNLFGAVYDTLPRPVRRFVSEAAFVEFCLRHQQRLLRKKEQ